MRETIIAFVLIVLFIDLILKPLQLSSARSRIHFFLIIAPLGGLLTMLYDVWRIVVDDYNNARYRENLYKDNDMFGD